MPSSFNGLFPYGLYFPFSQVNQHFLDLGNYGYLLNFDKCPWGLEPWGGNLRERGRRGLWEFSVFNINWVGFLCQVKWDFSDPLRVRYTVFRASRVTFFPANRVENQNEPKRRLKRTQTTPSGAVWVRFGFQLGLRQWEALITMHLDYGTLWGVKDPQLWRR